MIGTVPPVLPNKAQLKRYTPSDGGISFFKTESFRFSSLYHDWDSYRKESYDGKQLESAAARFSEARFIHEDSWAEGPPIMEGSPIELALGWVSELAPPFFVSPKAREAARMGMAEKEGKEQPENGIDFDSYF